MRKPVSPLVWTALSALATLAVMVLVAHFRKPAVPPAAEHDVWDARATVVEGEVLVFPKGASEGLLATEGMPLEDGDRVVTSSQARAELALSPESLIELGPNAAMTLADLAETNTVLELDLGALVAKLRWVKKLGRQMQVRTPTAVAAVRGTEFGLSVAENGETSVGVFDEGRVSVRATDDLMVKETTLEARQEVRIPPGTGVDTVTREDGKYLRVGGLERLKPYRERVERIRGRQEELGASWTGLSERDRLRVRRDFQERHEKTLEAMPEGERQAVRQRLQRPERGQPRPGGAPPAMQQRLAPSEEGIRPGGPGGDTRGGPSPDQGQHRGQDQGQHRGQDQGQHRGQDQGQHRGQDQGQHRGQDQGQHRGQDQGQQQGQRQPQHLQRVPGWQERNQQNGQRQGPGGGEQGGGQEQAGGRSRLPGGEQGGGDDQRRPGGPGGGPGGGGEGGMRPGGPGQHQGPGGGDQMQMPRLKRLPSLNEQGGPEGGGRQGGMQQGTGPQGGGQQGGGQQGGGMRPQGGPPGGGMHQGGDGPGGGGMRPQGGPPGGGMHQGGDGPGGGGMRPQGGPPGGGMHQGQQGGGPPGGGGMRPGGPGQGGGFGGQGPRGGGQQSGPPGGQGGQRGRGGRGGGRHP